MSYYLFGTLTPPAEKAAETVIPASGARDSFPIDSKMSDFMNGPGRFANGATLGFDSGETKIIERFFDGDIPLSPGRYSLSQILGGQFGPIWLSEPDPKLS